MLRSQRILLILMFVFVAWLLHTNTCEWVFRRQVSPERPLCAWTHDSASINPATAPRPLHLFPQVTGLIAQVDHTTALVAGVAAPLLLLACAVYLILGWKTAARLQGRCCLKCGYDLRGLTGPLIKCPECGTPTIST
jgi:hypothetical protein